MIVAAASWRGLKSLSYVDGRRLVSSCKGMTGETLNVLQSLLLMLSP